MGTRTPTGKTRTGKVVSRTPSKSSSSGSRVTVSASSFGIAGAGSNAALLEKYGSPEAKSATSSNVTPLTSVQAARGEAINQTVRQEVLKKNEVGNVITGNAFGFFSPTIANVQRISTTQATNNAERQQEQEARERTSFLDRIKSGVANLVSTREAIDDAYFGFGWGGSSPWDIHKRNRAEQIQKNAEAAQKKSEAEIQAAEADAQSRIEKAAIDAQAEKQILESANLSDIYDVSWLEKLGIGRSATEAEIQERMRAMAFYEAQADVNP
ncbi:hypothetical protein GOV10_00220, partial [Candidatus Woesearchaeota archaeon]|nr:hypothetical protein [Candidatus Woesearchaeota archaeon]